jgi:hypothetical protein
LDWRVSFCLHSQRAVTQFTLSQSILPPLACSVQHATVVVLIQHSFNKCLVFHHLQPKSGQQAPLESFPLCFLLVWQVSSITITFLGSCYQPISSTTTTLPLKDILPHDILIPKAFCHISCLCLVTDQHCFQSSPWSCQIS